MPEELVRFDAACREVSRSADALAEAVGALGRSMVALNDERGDMEAEQRVGHLEVGFNVKPGEVSAVYLDGVKQDGVVALNDAEGWLIRIEKNRDGTLRQSVYGPPRFVYEKVTGEVRVEMSPEWEG